MFRNILLDIPKRWLGGPKPRTGSLPRPVEHAFRRGFPAPVGRLLLHVRAEKRMAVGRCLESAKHRPTAIF